MLQHRLLHLSWLLLAGFALPARAASPVSTPGMLRDIHSGTTEVLSGSGAPYVSLDLAYLWRPSDYNGQEVLWRSDGTPEGTYPLGDRFPAAGDSRPFTFGSRTFFVAFDEAGLGLWKTDGTPTGTVLVRGGAARSMSASFSPVSLGGAFYFSAPLDETGHELWKSDGTPAGTVRVKDLVPGAVDSTPTELTVLGNTLYFLTGMVGSDDAPSCLWKSDGTEAGTVKLQQFPSQLRFGELEVVGSTVYMTARLDDFSSGAQYQLWKSDGTPAGTSKVMDLTEESPLATAVGDRLVFSTGAALWATDGTQAGTVQLSAVSRPTVVKPLGDKALFFDDYGLWSTNGTAAGTVKVAGGYVAASHRSMVFNGQLFFLKTGSGSVSLDLWKSDGTLAGTGPVTRVYERPYGNGVQGSDFAILGGELFFFVEGQQDEGVLWASNGTAAGTRQVYTWREPGFRFEASGLRVARGKLFVPLRLRAFSDEVRSQMWVTDGTAAGTVQLRRKPAPLGSKAEPLAQLGTSLLFFAEDEAHGMELWKTDGTSANTTLLKDLRPGTASGVGAFYRGNSARVGSTVFFLADDGVHGEELWKSDGTEAGTVLVKDIRAGAEPGVSRSWSWLQVVGNAVFFVADDGVHGAELWKSDGTEAGTVLIKDLRAGLDSGVGGSNSGPFAQVAALGSSLLFIANDGVHGRELWKSDGTEAGTVLVKDLRAGSESGEGTWLLESVLGGSLYFIANDGVHGAELWKSDGTEAGTVLVKDIAPGAEDSGMFLPPTAANGALYFSVLTLERGLEVWRSDGTEAGTRLLKLLQAPTPAFQGLTLAAFFTPVKNQVYFVGYDAAHGHELWKSDGTEAGTVLVKDLLPGPSNGLPLTSFFQLLALEEHGQLLFLGSDGQRGLEPWVTDGTEAGTSLVVDLNPGAFSSLSGNLWRFGERVFFPAADGVHGMELWSLKVEPLPVTPQPPAPPVTPEEPVTPAEPPTSCGGCQSSGAPGTLALWGLVLMLAGVRPRRRTR